jgi:ribosomal protein L32
MANETKIKTILIRCNECGHEERAAEYCPYTGYRYNTSWSTICHICKGVMLEVK